MVAKTPGMEPGAVGGLSGLDALRADAKAVFPVWLLRNNNFALIVPHVGALVPEVKRLAHQAGCASFAKVFFDDGDFSSGGGGVHLVSLVGTP